MFSVEFVASNPPFAGRMNTMPTQMNQTPYENHQRHSLECGKYWIEYSLCTMRPNYQWSVSSFLFTRSSWTAAAANNMIFKTLSVSCATLVDEINVKQIVFPNSKRNSKLEVHAGTTRRPQFTFFNLLISIQRKISPMLWHGTQKNDSNQKP